MKLIDVEQFKKWLMKIPFHDLSDGLRLCEVIFKEDFEKAVRELDKTVIDANPVKRGCWECGDKLDFGRGFIPIIICNRCGAMMPDYRIFTANYCPGCGADMRRRNDSDN